MSSEFRHGSEVPGISEVHEVDRGWLLQPGSSRILSANVMGVLWDVTVFPLQGSRPEILSFARYSQASFDRGPDLDG